MRNNAIQTGFKLNAASLTTRLSPVCLFTPPATLGSPGAGLPNAISTVGPGQPSATAINSAATPIDPSSMQRAYAALGLPYGNQSPAQVQGQGPAQQTPSGPQHQQQLRNMNALGTRHTDTQTDCRVTFQVDRSTVTEMS